MTTPEQKVTLTSTFRGALIAHADEHDLPLTTRQVEGLARAATTAVIDPEVPVVHREVVLSPQQREVLRTLAVGERTADMARRLCLSEFTIKTHRRLLFKKLGARTAAEAVAIGIGLELISVPAKRRQTRRRGSA
ncbi:response regulator transcription factor [Streptomyces odonnellii]|uniref:response regulator transcription factor n=1 Tax=Streptomyces odonnellii TaxID=1417980 RepID=UPI000697FAD4|nr:helix-turn-helix transcriptional regulator [Streptomyces odonnellii]